MTTLNSAGLTVGGIFVFSASQQAEHDSRGIPRSYFRHGDGHKIYYTELLPPGHDMTEVAARLPGYRDVGRVENGTTIANERDTTIANEHRSHRRSFDLGM